MPTVEPQTEALHFFRASQALVFSVLGTVLVVLTVPMLTDNYLCTTLAAIASIFAVVPAILALRRARRNRRVEPSIYFRKLRRNWALAQAVFAIAVVAEVWVLPRLPMVPRGRVVILLAVLYVAAIAFLLRFLPFYFVAAAVLVAAFVPYHFSQPPNSFALAALFTGALFWVGAFLVFSRTTQ